MTKKTKKKTPANNNSSKSKKAKSQLADNSHENKSIKDSKSPEKKSGESSVKKEKIKIDRAKLSQRVRGIILVIVGGGLLLLSVYFLYQRVFKADPLAKFLPANDTMALFELNLDSRDASSIMHKLDKYPVYQSANIKQQIDQFLQADYDTQIKPWLGRKVGLALVKESDSNPDASTHDRLNPIAFIEVKDFKQALDFLSSHKLENGEDALVLNNVDGLPVYEYKLGQSINFVFVDDYLVASLEKSALKQLTDNLKSKDNILKNKENYLRVANNLPHDTAVFGFFDLARLNEYILSSPNFVARNGFILTSFEPFLNIFESEGLTIAYDDDGIKLQTYTALNREVLEGKEFLTFKDKYRASLAKYVDQDAIMVWGGVNLEKQLKRIADLLAEGNQSSSVIFDSMLEAQKDTYFGKEVSLKEDLYPLIQDEFIVALFKGDPFHMQIVLNLQQDSDEQKVARLVEGFVKENAVFKPEVREVTLEDGTKGQEIVGVPEEIQRSEESYKNVKISELRLGSKPWGIYYFVQDNKLILATKKEIVTNIIDQNIKPLANSELFASNLAPILRHADELMYVNLDQSLPLIWPTVEEGGASSILQLYLDPFASLSSGKNYFDDGISTIHFLNIK